MGLLAVVKGAKLSAESARLLKWQNTLQQQKHKNRSHRCADGRRHACLVADVPRVLAGGGEGARVRARVGPSENPLGDQGAGRTRRRRSAKVPRARGACGQVAAAARNAGGVQAGGEPAKTIRVRRINATVLREKPFAKVRCSATHGRKQLQAASRRDVLLGPSAGGSAGRAWRSIKSLP
jgi:hypothetical protein